MAIRSVFFVYTISIPSAFMLSPNDDQHELTTVSSMKTVKANKMLINSCDFVNCIRHTNLVEIIFKK